MLVGMALLAVSDACGLVEAEDCDRVGETAVSAAHKKKGIRKKVRRNAMRNTGILLIGRREDRRRRWEIEAMTYEGQGWTVSRLKQKDSGSENGCWEQDGRWGGAMELG